MTECTKAYEEEIRKFLLGRFSKTSAAGSIAETEAELPTCRIRDWWILEGKRYQGCNTPLLDSMERIHVLARALLSTYNPRWRTSRLASGEIDWIATALHTATSLDREFVTRGSHAGLNDAERDALLGWIAWLRDLHDTYFKYLQLPPRGLPDWEHAISREFSTERLARWANIGRRSRWPLLRNIVAESLRCVLEAEVLDRLPLPTKHESLFELVCLVRLLCCLGPTTQSVKWLDFELDNEVRTHNLTIHYQRTFDREQTLRGGLFPTELAVAMSAHEVHPPTRSDLIVRFASPRRGFAGILLECKSGALGARDTVYQLMTYRSMLRRELPGPLLVWGVIESPLAPVFVDTDATEDRWLFSSADYIPKVIASLGLASG